MGAWTVPKGEVHIGEDLFTAAVREFYEETGFRPDGEATSLGFVRQAGGKRVHVWAINGDWDPSTLVSNSFSMEWPPRSGQIKEFPEIDRAGWFTMSAAREKILKSQLEFLHRLEAALNRV
jgi:predicted NUDIX family NTP pyrophosphohydrolase